MGILARIRVSYSNWWIDNTGFLTIVCKNTVKIFEQLDTVSQTDNDSKLPQKSQNFVFFGFQSSDNELPYAFSLHQGISSLTNILFVSSF